MTGQKSISFIVMVANTQDTSKILSHTKTKNFISEDMRMSYNNSDFYSKNLISTTDSLLY